MLYTHPNYTQAESAFHKEMIEQGYTCVRKLESGEWIGVTRLIYTAGLCMGMDQSGYQKRYCYEHMFDAIEAYNIYTGIGDPPGPWIKVKGDDGEEVLGPGAKSR